MRLLCAAALSLSFGLWVALAEDRKLADTPKTERAEKFAAIKKKFETENKTLTAQFTKAETAAEERSGSGRDA